MRAHVVAVALAAAAVTAQAPAASAAHDAADCRLRAVAQDSLTGPDQFEGVLAGFTASRAAETVKVQCRIEVNGVVVAGTAEGAGTGVAAVAERVTYHADNTDDVRVCVRAYTDAHGWKESCWGWGLDPFDLVNGLPAAVFGYADPVVCEVLKGLAGTHGPVYVNEQGDVYVDGQPQYDCPPYDIVWP